MLSTKALGGGASTTLSASHSSDQTGWNMFYSTSSPSVNTSVAGEVSITLNEGTATQTTDSDFSTWATSSVFVSSTGRIVLLKPNGATCTGTNVLASECSNGWCNGSSQCSAIPPCLGLTSVDYSGQTYNLVTIGTQCWFSQNLNVGTMLASAGTLPSNNSLIEKWCYNNSSANCTTYGGLYTWAEANQLATTCDTNSCTPSSPSQGICPSGWHIPTDAEYKTLESYLGMCAGAGDGCVDAVSWRGTTQGTQLKSGGSSGFNVLLTGLRLPGGSFGELSTYSGLWTASGDSATGAWYHYFHSAQAGVYRYPWLSKAHGMSVRCLKN